MRHKMNNTGLFRRTIAMLIAVCMLTSGFSPSAFAQTPDIAQADVSYTVEGDMQNESSPQAPPENVTESEPEADSESSNPESSNPESSSPESSSPESSNPESSNPESSSPESSNPESSNPESSSPESSVPEDDLPGNELQEPVSNVIDGQASWPVLVNGASAEIVGGQFATVDYNEPITLSLDGYSGTGVPGFLYQTYTADGPGGDWLPWASGLTPTPGQYYLGWEVETDSDISGNYGIEIVPVALKAPVNPKWNAGTANWDTVTTDKNGNPLKADAVTGYELALYKDNGADAVATATVGSSAMTYDFEEKLLESGAGTYTYTVQALASTDASACYTSSEASTASTATHVVAVTLEGDTGIASVTPAESFLLLQGKSASIGAVPKENFVFGSWDCPADMTVTGDSNATLAIPEEYGGGTEVTITANTTTTTAPTVTDYAAGTDDQYGTLLATAQDTASGITAYAFSTAGTADAVGASEWKPIEPKPNEPVSFTHEVAAAGNYYFYAKNAYGHAVKSGVFIQATQVTYKEYGTVSDQTVYLLGDKPLTLVRPTRAGFAFGGWYRSADTTGTAITELGQADHSTSPILLYAKWTREPVTITQHPQPLTVDYDGQPHELGVTVSNTTGEIAYQWYKDNTAISGATVRSYAVKDVTDSGSYHVVVTVTAEGDNRTAQSNVAAVAITQAPLTVAADDITIKHGEAPPTYTVRYEGFKGEDDATNSNLTAGTITCSYTLGGDAKEYDIIPSGFAAPNYTITHKKGTLTVQAKTVEEARLTATLSQTSYTYTGAACTPAVTVKEGEKTLAAETDYTVAYTDNTSVGTAKVTITFQGNYKGVINLTFTIAKATFTPTVSLADWIYGDTAKMPQVNGNTSGGVITYHYVKADGTVLAQKPTNAGSYTVYAVVAPTVNYDGVTTAKAAFTIAKREISLTAPTQSWVYDGNSHSAANYTMTGDFAGSDSFLSVAVTGQITNVSKVANVITYTLPSSTNADNYKITCTNGTLTVTAQTLTVPVNHRWVSTTPGLASWVAVTRNDLDVQYEVKLYRAGVDGSDAALVTTVTANDNEYDFKDDIKADTEAHSSAGYYFTVQAIPAGGANKDNYTRSATSGISANIYTMQVSVKKTAGIDSVTIGGTAKAVLLQGESAAITATAATGYILSKSIWKTDAEATQLSFGDAAKATTTVRVSATLAAPCDAEIWASAEDEKPVIKTFTAQANDDHSGVTFTLNAQDTLAVTGWMITTGATAPDRDDAGWQSVDDVAELTATKEGTYYAWIRDGSHVVGAEAPIAVYEIKFDGGTGATGGPIPPMLKVQNTTLTLPANTYRKAGYSFKNWLGGTTGLYTDGGNYAANASDTLTAQWSNDQFSYRVNYFFMGTDGSYKSTEDAFSTFVAAHGATISTNTPAIQLVRTGMTLDTDKPGSIVVDENGKSLNVYYKRIQRTITYSYQEPGETGLTTDTKTYLYGAEVLEREKPVLDGYTFVGWLYGEAGQKPATMPNQNITATGTFSPNQASYIISYFEQDLGADGKPTGTYTPNSALTETKNALHAQNIFFAASGANAKSIPGFSVLGVTATVGQAGGSTPEKPSASVMGTVSAVDANKLYVNYYYTRNKYILTLNVWKGARDVETNRLYTTAGLWELAYGAPITADAAETYANYEKDKWTEGNDVAGYALAEYADWSTGTVPTSMPAGNITVSRDYVSTTSSSYQLEIYYEDDAGNYPVDSRVSLTYYADKGKEVRAGHSTDDPKPDISYDQFGSSLNEIAYYEYKQRDGEVKSGTVTDVPGGENPLTLKLYFQRKTVDITVRYYYDSGDKQQLIGTLTQTGTWGTQYKAFAPLAFFDGDGVPAEWKTDYISGNANIGGTLAENYKFKANAYVASYTGRYELRTKRSWPNKRYYSVESLTEKLVTDADQGKNEIPIFGDSNEGSTPAYINVYYTEVKRNDSDNYVLDVAYATYMLNKSPEKLAGETAQKHTKFPLTKEIDGKTYKVRVANKADVFEATFAPASGTEKYPGLGVLNGQYVYDSPEVLREGFTAVELSRPGSEALKSTYYTKTEGGVDYLYVIDEENQFFAGNFPSYNFLKDPLNNAWPGYDVVEKYLEQYKIDHGDSAAEGNSDENIAGVSLYNGGFSSIVLNTEQPTYYTLSFEYKTAYQVTYDLGGTKCTDHKYVTGSTVENPGCSHTGIFALRDGYKVTWYRDTSYETPATAFVINGPTTLYGRYEKITLDGHEYIHYQLADALTVDGKETSYITAENVHKITGITSNATTQETDFTDGAGKTVKLPITTTTYTYNGQSVLIDKSYPVLTFTPIEMTQPAAPEGFYYDTTNAGNRLLGYCQAGAVPLAVYFARNEHAVTVVPNDAKVSNSTTTNYRFGQTVALTAPTKGGYMFAGWEWYKWIGAAEAEDVPSNWTKWTDSPAGTDGTTHFTMPALRLKAEAKWTPAAFDQPITHYFQGSAQTYETELLKALKGTGLTTATKPVTFEGASYTATVYSKDGAVLGLSLPFGADTAWFPGKSIGSKESITLEAADLIAMETTVKLTSEVETQVQSHQIPDDRFDMFSYSFTVYQSDTAVETLGAADKFTNQYGMQVDYYYIRQSDYTIRTVAKAQDGGEPGATLAGKSTHYYGEPVTLTANLPAGYDIVGWYKAADALEGYTADMADWTTCVLKENITTPPLSITERYQLSVIEALDLVVVTKPQAVDLPTVTISGRSDYIYGYAASPANALTANVTGVSADTAIKGYQWYDQNNVAIANATSSTYLFPSGQAAGSYQYKCKVMVGRKDNGRTETVTTEFYPVTVAKGAMELEATDYSATYDGKPHGISVKVKTPEDAGTYTVYYADKALTADNYRMNGTTENLVYTDVAVNESGVAVPRTVYYYVHSTDNNFVDKAGSSTVTIRPITLSIKASKAYSKVFDGEAKILGDVNTPGTGKYELAHDGYYTVSGMLAGQAEGHLVDFDAVFNTPDVVGSSYVTLSSMKVVGQAGNINYNYTFSPGSTLTLSGFIQQFPLAVSWSTDNLFTYNGAPQAPTVTLNAGQTPPDAAVALSVTGMQTNVGTYTAYAAVEPSAAYTASNYSFAAGGSCPFEIAARELTITPEGKTKTYDKSPKKLEDFTVTGLVEGQNYSASTDKGATNAGTYTITAQNAQITADGKLVTYNYDITYGTGTLQITPQPVTISGITAANKVYDGTTDATLNLAGVGFEGLITGDTLALNADKISGSFDTAHVGTGKAVTLTKQDGLLGGASVANYTLNWAGSQQSTTANITAAGVVVTAQSVETVYGETAPFAVTYSPDIAVTGDPIYKVRKRGTTGEFKTYDPTSHGAGSYDIQLDTTDLSAANYTFEVGVPATLTVNKRLVEVRAVSNANISKVYDAKNTAMVTAAHYEFVGITGDSQSGLVNSDTLTLKAGFAAAYNSKDVAAATTVTVSGLAVANDNYDLKTTTFDLDGEITTKPLTVTAVGKTTTYGKSAPAFTASYGTFAEGEGVTDLGDGLKFTCAYDINHAANRDAKNYTITPSGYAKGNYAITYVDGTLTVNKAVISVTAEDATYTYRGQTETPTYTGILFGFQYDDPESVVANLDKVTYTCDKDLTSAAGVYLINPQGVDELSATNYEFKAVPGKLTVIRKIIKIGGIKVSEKRYDGTVVATANNITSSDITYDGLEAADASQKGITVVATFEDAAVGKDKTVRLTVTLNSHLAARYSLDTSSQTTATANITEQTLTVTAENKSVTYGGTPPTYTVTYSGFVNAEDKTALGGTLTFDAPYEANSNTNTYTEVGTYTNAITPSGYASDNYTFTYASGTLTVTQAKLATPSPKWSAADAGTVTWAAVPKIGNVDVDSYKLELFKSGTTAAVHTVNNIARDKRSVDLLEVIRTAGVGSYTVKVTAIASLTNNVGNKNVADSAAGPSAAIYAASASVAFASDAVSKAGGTGTPTIGGTSTYVVVAGEKDLHIAATLKNSTGYTVKSCAAGDPKITITAGALAGVNYTAKAAVGAITSASPIVITLILNATPATIAATVTADKSEVNYGYADADAPKLTVTAAPAEGDSIGVSEYTYTYQWRLKKGIAGTPTDIVGATSSQLTFPLNQLVAKYSVDCKVTATRNDNGQSKMLLSPATTITINRSPFQSTVSLAGWTYGEARKTPTVSSNPDACPVSYTYSTDNSTWETAMPTNAGTYYVRAKIAEGAHYEETTTPSVSFTIARTKLATPTELKMEASPTAPYGKATWKAVAGPKENAGTNSASSVGVTYRVKLYHRADEQASSQLIKTYDRITACAYDLTGDIGGTGIYTFTVTAVSNNQTNCADSAESTASAELNVSGKITAKDDIFEKEYDGTPIMLTVECAAGMPDGYQWYRDDKAIEGATSATYHVTYVEQSGSYSCNITVGSATNSSMHQQVEITPRAIAITAGSATKVYDGTALTADSHTITAGSLAIGDAITSVTVTGSQTNAGTSSNTPSAAIIKANDDDRTNNYTLTYPAGTLTVTAKPLTAEGITVSDPMKKTYDGTQQKPSVTVTHQQNTPVKLTEGADYTIAYGANVAAGSGSVTVTGKGNYTGPVTKQFTIHQRAITVTSANIIKPYDGTALKSTALTDLTATNLATGDQLASVNFTGSRTEVGSSDNTFENVVIENADNANVTANYAITSHYGSITIGPVKDIVVITGDPRKLYDGTPVSNPTFTQNGTGAVTFQYYTKTGSDYTALAGAPKDAGDYYVKALVAASGNYSASESDYKAFTVAKRALTITPDDQTSVYGKPLAALTYTTSPDRIAADDALKITLTTTATSTSAVGNYSITVGTDATASRNYTITPKQGNYSITGATMVVTASGYRGTYDGAAHGITVTHPAGATVKYRTAATGSYDLTESPTYTDEGTYTVYYLVSAPNHLDASGSKTVEITKAAQTITAANVTAEYDGNPHAVTATTSGDGAVTYVGNSPIKAGTHTVTIHAAETTNYAAATKTATVTISARPLTILANSDTKIYDGTALTANGYTIKAGSLANGDIIDAVTVTGSQTDAGTGSNTPSAAVIMAGGDNRTQSYTITYKDGALEVTKAPQAAPTGLIGHNETIETKGDGSISGIKSGMEYRKKGETAYTAVTAQMVTNGAIPGVTSGVYEVRYAETKNYFASAPTEVTIGFETAAVYALTLTAPTLAELTEGYAQPQAEPLTITSTGNAAATIASVTSSDPAFEITGSGSTVPVDGTLTGYGVRLAAGLAAGSYKADITVTYNNGATATDEVAVEVKPRPPAPAGGGGGSGDTSSSQPPVKPELPTVQPPANTESPAGQPQTAPDAKDTVEQASSVPVNQTPDGINNAALEDKKVVVQETLPFGSGSIQVTVDCIETEQRRVEAALVSSQQVVNACLSEQEKQSVVNGDSIEIRLTVKLCQTEVPQTDAELITRQVETLQSEISGLTFGDYVDISLDKRLNGGNWKRITQTDGDIAIEIAIPKWLQFPNTDYFISRAHNGGVTLLEDTDNDPQTITIPTQYFSTYAILYTATAVTEQASYCIWHILMLVVLASYLLLIFIGKPRKNRGLLPVGAIVLFILAAAMGACAWDWPVALLSTAAAAAAVTCRSKSAARKNK